MTLRRNADSCRYDRGSTSSNLGAPTSKTFKSHHFSALADDLLP